MTAPYTHLIEWRGVLVTVDCDAEPDDNGLTMLPVRVLVGERDITALVDMEAGDLAALVQYAYNFDGRGRIEND